MKSNLALFALGLVAYGFPLEVQAYRLSAAQQAHIIAHYKKEDDDSTNVQVENIYGIPSDSEKA